MASGLITIEGEEVKQWQIIFSWAPKSLWMLNTAMKWKDAWSFEKIYDKSGQCIKRQRHHFANKYLYILSYGFSSSHAHMWELDHKKSWVLKNWYFQIVVLEKTPESPLDGKEIKPVNKSQGESTLNIYWKVYCWIWSSNTLATWCEELTLWKRPWGWERLKAKGEGSGRG